MGLPEKISGETIQITNEMLKSAATNGVGYSKKQAEALGLRWPQTQGWKDRLIGKSIPIEQWERFVAARKQRRKAKMKTFWTILVVGLASVAGAGEEAEPVAPVEVVVPEAVPAEACCDPIPVAPASCVTSVTRTKIRYCRCCRPAVRIVRTDQCGRVLSDRHAWFPRRHW